MLRTGVLKVGLVAGLLAVAGVLAGRAALAPAAGRGPLAARDQLLLVAAVAGRAAGDGSAGPYSRIRLVRWVRTPGGEARFDSERWRAPDGSGRLAERRPAGPLSTADYPPGALRLGVGEPFPASADALRTALPADPGGVLTALLDAVGLEYLGPAQRAAVLRVLAGLPGLAYTGRDRLGLGFALVGRVRVSVDPATAEITGWHYGDAERVEIVARGRVPTAG